MVKTERKWQHFTSWTTSACW